MSAAIDDAITYLRDLAEQGFWGFVTLKYEGGLLSHMRVEKNLKPNELKSVSGVLPGKNRGMADVHNNQ